MVDLKKRICFKLSFPYALRITYLEVSGGNPDIVLLSWMVELGEPPVDESELPVLMVDHNIVWFDVPVHDAHAVAVVQGLEELVQVVPDVIVSQGLIQLLEISVVHVLKDQGGGSGTGRRKFY